MTLSIIAISKGTVSAAPARRRTFIGKGSKLNRIDLSALQQFDSLPNAAHVRLPVVAALMAVSPATVWRWSHRGKLPAPVRINGVTLWNVGSLRDCIRLASVPVDDAAPPAETSQ